jgi:hypothetical protein
LRMASGLSTAGAAPVPWEAFVLSAMTFLLVHPRFP